MTIEKTSEYKTKEKLKNKIESLIEEQKQKTKNCIDFREKARIDYEKNNLSFQKFCSVAAEGQKVIKSLKEII